MQNHSGTTAPFKRPEAGLVFLVSLASDNGGLSLFRGPDNETAPDAGSAAICALLSDTRWSHGRIVLPQCMLLLLTFEYETD